MNGWSTQPEGPFRRIFSGARVKRSRLSGLGATTRVRLEPDITYDLPLSASSARV